jgi:hypothetical protein
MSKKPRSRSAPNPAWFPTGHCGNPKGRPRGSRARAPKDSAFEVFVGKTLIVSRGGVTREITLKEGLQQRLFEDALAGKIKAMREVAKWIMKRDTWLAKRAATASRPAIKRYFSPDPDNADTALLLLGIAAPNPARADYGAKRAPLLLEPWAAQAALSRRRGGRRLTDKERDEIRRCTRDPDSLRWPRGTGQ